MKLNEAVVLLICEKFWDDTVYIGEDIRQKEPQYISAIENSLKTTTNLKKADVVIENNVADFFAPVVITDSINDAASVYEQRSINKALGVSMYVRRDRLFKNPYIEQNIYRLNYNPDLYNIRLRKQPVKKHLPVNYLYGKYGKERLVIVGGGESWQEIDWKRKADDVRVMIVNYNFHLKADFLIYNDKQVGRDLENIWFNDNRKIIGYENHKSRVADYVYNIPKDTTNVTHTGAMAIQIAEKMQFEKIYLAGFDYKKNKNGKDQVYKKLKNDYYKDSRIKRFLIDFDKFKTKRTYNLNRNSNLQKLPFANKEELYK